MTLIEDIFMRTDMIGYIGPMALVIIGHMLSRRDRTLGVLWFVFECLFVAHYFILIETDPAYWWHTIILLLGGLITCVFPMFDR